jgi:hypothetical protein
MMMPGSWTVVAVKPAVSATQTIQGFKFDRGGFFPGTKDIESGLVQPYNVAWCAEHLPFGTFQAIDTATPLARARG